MSEEMKETKEEVWVKNRCLVWIYKDDFKFLVENMPYSKSFSERFNLFLKQKIKNE